MKIGTIVHQFGEDMARAYRAGMPPGVKLEALPPERLWAIPPEAEILLLNSARKATGLTKTMPRPKGWPANLKWTQLRSTGIDFLPDWVFNVPLVTVARGGQAPAISEYVLTAMLTFEKRVPELFVHDRADWRQSNLGSLAGKTVGIVGYGHIGQAVARRAMAFDMKAVGFRRSDRPSPVPGVAMADLAGVVSAADHLVLSAPLTAETHHLVDAAAIARMKPTAHIVNVGRGAVLDTEALHAALDAGRIAGATLDVTDPEPPPPGHWLYTHPRVRLSPHISHSAPDADAVVTQIFFDNLGRYLAGNTAGLHGVASLKDGY